ncbi:CaiB/BaiF CoA-transferase family protein [Bradyrhizobium sp.]|uniref:CaiB/BaiF CoA transferase family protein n=1 Tax=Bradyrhizobium sp. TaxID=376 RepID=UPI002D2E9ADA|nr:CaiB/BaiF CoA-transferase family protein [Bradyrhizobium sp.]HZR77017.1 CaiB/BaiF CoA-transferase family protein [Bradyrhizobium sp.]
MSRPLAGLRVLELARILAGPWAGQILADLGADVIKVERKGPGDDTRGWGPPFVESAEGARLDAAYFHAANRGKRSIEIDFDAEDGRRIVRKLAARSDVLLENFRVGGLAKFGLDYQSLAPENPRLIYCSVTGFGQDGPYASRAGYDLMVQGMGGIMSITGEPGGEPMRVGIPIADIFTGVYAAVGVLAALAQREKTGCGCLVDAALLDTQVGVLANQALSYLVTGAPPQRIGNMHPVVTPYQVFAVADGHVIIACGNDGQFVKLCEVLGAPQIAQDPKYRSNADRVVNRDSLVRALGERTRRFARDDLLAKLEAVTVPAGPINDLAQVFADAQVVARGMRIERPNAAAKDGKVAGVRTPLIFDGWRAAADRGAPALGEHSPEILREIGEG